MLPKHTLHLLIYCQEVQLKLYSTIIPEAEKDEPNSSLYCVFFHAIPAPHWKVKMKREPSAMPTVRCKSHRGLVQVLLLSHLEQLMVSVSKILDFQDRMEEMALHFIS